MDFFIVFSSAAAEAWPSFLLEQKEAKIQDPLEASPRKNPTHGSPSESGPRYERREKHLVLVLRGNIYFISGIYPTN